MVLPCFWKFFSSVPLFHRQTQNFIDLFVQQFILLSIKLNPSHQSNNPCIHLLYISTIQLHSYSDPSIHPFIDPYIHPPIQPRIHPSIHLSRHSSIIKLYLPLIFPTIHATILQVYQQKKISVLIIQNLMSIDFTETRDVFFFCNEETFNYFLKMEEIFRTYIDYAKNNNINRIE